MLVVIETNILGSTWSILGVVGHDDGWLHDDHSYTGIASICKGYKQFVLHLPVALCVKHYRLLMEGVRLQFHLKQRFMSLLSTLSSASKNGVEGLSMCPFGEGL